MTTLILYDDARARAFEPYVTTRPVGELRAGAALIRERWERAFAVGAAGFVSATHLAEFEEPGAPASWARELSAGTVLVNSRCVSSLDWHAGAGEAWSCEGRLAALRLPRAVPVAMLADGEVTLERLAGDGPAVEIPGRWIDEIWELITTLAGQLFADIMALGPGLDTVPPTDTVMMGSHGVYIERGATVEPLTVLDAGAGPILVRAGAEVRSFTRLVGPCFVGAGATVLGDRVHACAIGDRSLVRGEISESVFIGHCNKAHDGFVGHSYLGRWVNLGAGTTTSNLKNTYGSVSLWTPSGTRDSGTIKLGTFFGDHVKTGIGLRLTTGSLIGAGSNIYGAAMPPKYVPPFAWGEGERLDVYDVERFLATTERAMGRRQVALGERGRRQLATAHARAMEQR